jgi:hypothetical protein
MLLIAGAALAEEAPPAPGEGLGLFSGAEESPLLISADLLYLRGKTRTVGGRYGQDFENNDNLMAVLRFEYVPPASRWISAWARVGGTVQSSGARALGQKADADYLLAELNLGISLAGRGSPLAPASEMQDSHLEAYIGLRRFEEKYDLADLDVDAEVTWTGPQLGLRGEWVLADTYPELPGARNWSLALDAAFLPWVRYYSESHAFGTKLFYETSDTAYGFAWAASANYRRGPVTFTAGYENQTLKTDRGDYTDDSLNGDLYHANSYHSGVFGGVTVHF